MERRFKHKDKKLGWLAEPLNEYHYDIYTSSKSQHVGTAPTELIEGSNDWEEIFPVAFKVNNELFRKDYRDYYVDKKDNGNIMSLPHINTLKDTVVPIWHEKDIPVERTWEIVEFKNTNGAILRFDSSGNCIARSDDFSPISTMCLYNCLNKDGSIHSVKRISDGEIFTVGDWFVYDGAKHQIKSFGFDEGVGDNFLFLYKGLGNTEWINLNLAFDKLVKIERKPLFTTEDGVDIYDGNSYWYAQTDRENIAYNIFDYNDGVKRFSTEEAAKEWASERNLKHSDLDVREALAETLLLSEENIDSVIVALNRRIV